MKTDLRLIRYSGPPVGALDEAGKRLYYRACDLTARFWLNDMGMPEFDAKNFEGCAMLVHAERYLADRLAYELAPWPKGMMKIEPDDAYALPGALEVLKPGIQGGVVNDAMACCGHLNIVYAPVTCDGKNIRGEVVPNGAQFARWECRDCKSEFGPLSTLRTALARVAWISVEERLPKLPEEELVLVLYSNPYHRECTSVLSAYLKMSGETWGWLIDCPTSYMDGYIPADFVTHWMPMLPDPTPAQR